MLGLVHPVLNETAVRVNWGSAGGLGAPNPEALFRVSRWNFDALRQGFALKRALPNTKRGVTLGCSDLTPSMEGRPTAACEEQIQFIPRIAEALDKPAGLVPADAVLPAERRDVVDRFRLILTVCGFVLVLAHVKTAFIIIQTAIATIMRFSVRDMNPKGTLLSPPRHAHFNSRFST